LILIMLLILIKRGNLKALEEPGAVEQEQDHDRDIPNGLLAVVVT
jgi:hypothetical protein